MATIFDEHELKHLKHHGFRVGESLAVYNGTVKSAPGMFHTVHVTKKDDGQVSVFHFQKNPVGTTAHHKRTHPNFDSALKYVEGISAKPALEETMKKTESSLRPGQSYRDLKNEDTSQGSIDKDANLIQAVGIQFQMPVQTYSPPIPTPVDASDKSRLETVEPKVLSFRDRLKEIRTKLMGEYKKDT